MRILNVEDSKKKHGVIIRAIMGEPEFKQLVGNLDNLCVFATKTLTEPATFIKTGARHSFAKYLLLPVALRRKLKTDEFDFEQLACATIEYKDKVYVVYGVGKRSHATSSGEKGNLPQ